MERRLRREEVMTIGVLHERGMSNLAMVRGSTEPGTMRRAWSGVRP